MLQPVQTSCISLYPPNDSLKGYIWSLSVTGKGYICDSWTYQTGPPSYGMIRDALTGYILGQLSEQSGTQEHGFWGLKNVHDRLWIC
ncbi:hypothetical protein J6TS7_43330 [Paenibacillus dendritiformis]|nr:hypothetical protein J6TS7_43330 [Paenibacillus dendritiformis]